MRRDNQLVLVRLILMESLFLLRNALKEGFLFARLKGIKNLMVEGDLRLVIQVVQGNWVPPWHLKPIIEDIKWLASDFQNISWKQYIQRS